MAARASVMWALRSAAFDTPATKPARIAMMAMTINSSTRVKPFPVLRRVVLMMKP